MLFKVTAQNERVNKEAVHELLRIPLELAERAEKKDNIFRSDNIVKRNHYSIVDILSFLYYHVKYVLLLSV